MFRNYCKTAFRSLLKHRFFSAINIFGLAVSMSVCMAIMTLVADQMMYDRFNTNRDRIYRINTIPISENGEQWNETGTTTLPVMHELMEDFGGVESGVRIIRGFGNSWMELDQNVNIPVSGFFTDPGALAFFQYELEFGDPKTALVEPWSVVLTKQAAKRLFRSENPVGELLKVRENEVYKITGVLRETKNKSHIVFDALASIATVTSKEAGQKQKTLDNWYNYTDGWVYIMANDGTSIQDIETNLHRIEKKHFSKLQNPDTQKKVEYHLQSLTSINPGAFINNPIGPFLPWIFIWFFAGIGTVIMLTSCFNFTNLSIARSLTRAREIGIRKVTGAVRRQIFAQFIAESVIVALIALVIAIGFLNVLKPMILQLNFARIMKWGFEENYYVYGAFVVFTVVVGILAGLFPALVLSGFQPIKVLKNLQNMKLFSRMGMRKALLVTQFSFSLIFILTVIVVFNQLSLLLTADHGFEMDSKVVVYADSTSIKILKAELQKDASIESVSASSHVPANGETRGSSYKRTLEDKDWNMLYYYSVDEDYLRNMKLALVAGKFYTAGADAANRRSIVLSEHAVKSFHFGSPEEAIGQEIISQSDSSKRRIIGVVKDYRHKMLLEKPDPLALVYDPRAFAILQVHYTTTYHDATKRIDAAWAKMNTGSKVDYRDFSDEVHKMYNILFGDVSDILAVISFLSIFISSLGLLGMATYATETRRKEISIRKVLGIENNALILLLSKGFVGILILSTAIAVPLAWVLNNLWLELLASHVSFDATVMITGIGILLGFGVLTIGSQTIRAAFVNPVENLKE